MYVCVFLSVTHAHNEKDDGRIDTGQRNCAYGVVNTKYIVLNFLFLQLYIDAIVIIKLQNVLNIKRTIAFNIPILEIVTVYNTHMIYMPCYLPIHVPTNE